MGRDWLSLLWDWVPFKYPWPNTPPEPMASRLLVAQGVQAVVEEDPEAVDHVFHGLRHQIQKQYRRYGPANARKQQNKPPQGKARRKGHAQKDEKEGEGVAHVS